MCNSAAHSKENVIRLNCEFIALCLVRRPLFLKELVVFMDHSAHMLSRNPEMYLVLRDRDVGDG